MKWRLGLRNDKRVKTDSVGIKSINLANNLFTDKFAMEVAYQFLACDRYMKCLNLRNNKIGTPGLEKLCRAVS